MKWWRIHRIHDVVHWSSCCCQVSDFVQWVCGNIPFILRSPHSYWRVFTLIDWCFAYLISLFVYAVPFCCIFGWDGIFIMTARLLHLVHRFRVHDRWQNRDSAIIIMVNCPVVWGAAVVCLMICLFHYTLCTIFCHTLSQSRPSKGVCCRCMAQP